MKINCHGLQFTVHQTADYAEFKYEQRTNSEEGSLVQKCAVTVRFRRVTKSTLKHNYNNSITITSSKLHLTTSPSTVPIYCYRQKFVLKVRWELRSKPTKFVQLRIYKDDNIKLHYKDSSIS